MVAYEYKLEYVTYPVTGKERDAKLVEVLNRFGAEGWRLNRMYGEVSLRSLASLGGGVNLLLEREIADAK